MPNLSQVSQKCKVESVKSKNIIVSLLSLFILIFSLFTLNLTFPAPAFAAPGGQPNPQACANPMPTDNLTDNYITDENGDPPADLRFFFSATGNVGEPKSFSKDLEFSVDFSKLQAIFAAQNSDNLEGGFQNTIHSQTNLLGLTNANLMKFQGPVDKASSKAWTDQLRTKYVEKIWEKPEIAESKNTFTENNGQNPKTVYDLVTAYNLPKPPKPSEDQTLWLNTWGKYWLKIPTAYNEFTEGKLEFRAISSKPLIEKVKNGELCAMPIRTVKFPVPNFFRTAAVSGQLNQVIVPKSAQSQDNNLILGGILGVKNAVGSIIQKCVKIITNNPFTNTLKKTVNISLENLNPARPVYAATNCSIPSGLTIHPGDSIDVTHSGFANGESIRIFGTLYQKEMRKTSDSTTSTKTSPSTIPSDTVVNQDYTVVIVTRFPITSTTCSGGTFRVTAVNSGNNKATPISVNQIGCALNAATGTQMVSATFTWTPADNPVIVAGSSLPVLAQFLDYSVFDNGWVDLTFQGQDVGIGSSSYTFTAFFAPNIDYYWRINTNYFPGGLAGWSPSATATFKTITCASGNNKATPISVNQIGCALNAATGTQMVSATFTWICTQHRLLLAY